MWCAALQVEVPTISNHLSGDLQENFLSGPSRMDRDRDKMAERILHLTLEILYRLTGEDYTVVKKTSSERCQAPVSEGWGRPLSPITGPPPHPLIHEDINDQKILELTYKMMELLTGEVPIRCQDVTVYLSMEEWMYLEGHKDQYKDIMMEVSQPFTSPVLFSKRTTPERCSEEQDCSEENHNVPQDHQGKDLTYSDTAETNVRSDERYKEKIPIDDSTDGCCRSSEKHLLFSHFKEENRGVKPDSYEEQILIPDRLPNLHIKKLSTDPFQQVLSSDSSQTVEHSKNNSTDMQNQTTHTQEKSFSCSECQKCFISKSNLVRHQRIHTKEKSYSCSECGKCFLRNSNLVEHQRIHTNEKPHSCSECGKCFAQRGTLFYHERIHTKKKSFSCPECGKCFSKNGTLVEHQRIHTGEKPFSCPECGKCFIYKANMIVHQRIHTKEKPYSCSECGKCFRNKWDLVRHLRIHTEDKPFSCPECGKCFNDRSALSKHKRTHTE
ncbi:gastrula zinc finger protein XlCGF66.1-like isoform X1 [Ranitomeya variabilis]|uniref:gastrula zinc finger protein XlCGF66.1-like isoform X1 n=1 Tax=Ranitomeya variabilis TaxID=490064 RepID=UPI004056B343